MKFRTALAFLTLLFSGAAFALDDGVIRVKSAYPLAETVARLKQDVAAKGIRFFDEIDQSKLAADAGIKVLPSTLLVFGNPPPGIGGKYFIFVKLTTDSDVIGYGEAYNAAFSAHVTAKMIEDVAARYLVGHDPHDIENFFRRAYSSGFTQRPRHVDDGLRLGAGNGLLGHYRQGGGQAGLQAARRAGA